VWTTPAGPLRTNKIVRGEFTIPELHDNKLIRWKIHIAPNLGNYDMIIGRDLMSDLNMDVKFSTQTIEWEKKNKNV
jgi:hypothetical protein